jgi:hypothetical protein
VHPTVEVGLLSNRCGVPAAGLGITLIAFVNREENEG